MSVFIRKPLKPSNQLKRLMVKGIQRAEWTVLLTTVSLAKRGQVLLTLAGFDAKAPTITPRCHNAR